MSVDTRTPRTPTGGSPGGFFDDEPILSSVKVPSDPAQVIVNNVSFRVKLATPTPQSPALADTAQRLPGAPAGAAAPLAPAAVSVPAAAAAGAATAVKRRAPVVWSGQSAPGDTAATRLLDAVRPGGLGTVPPQADGQRSRSAGSTQVLPRVTPDLTVPPSVVGPRPPQDERPLLDGVRPAEGAYDTPAHGTPATDGDGYEGYDAGRYELAGDDRRPAREGADRARHAYYPGRRMNLGVVLLPLRIFLGFISIYAGMGKLTDPVYFEGGERGSMVHWLESLEPWTIAAPLHGFAVAHPVGAGLTVAFLQVLVGVLTVCGLWQRLAAGVGALLSAALLVTVSWRSVPVYDAPDIIYLAAWSPLVIAGAPVYSLDARLTSEAWRRLGPRVALWDLRRRVLRRGALMAAVVAGLTLLVGSLLGSAVRSAQVTTVPAPGEPLRNHQPGSPLPQDPASRPSQGVTTGPTAGPSAGPSAEPSTTPSPDAAEETTGSDGTGDAPSQDQTVQAPAPPPAPEPPAPPPAPEPPTDGSSGGTPDGSTGGTTGGSGDDSGDSTDGSSGGGALGGLLG
ncbi:DoxX family protein [Streptomyces sp. WMMC897]|uniref:DoxX family protein n=1 Tax=Streptomyces sp. WMMC897 TaxID=3014782 RepID=UPI0022B6948B|nr:DoxX family protein [Streptomyces sp. WMMC897]MCZ7414979.1 DoxX family protein [Streptomyces sp. WMMC897]